MDDASTQSDAADGERRDGGPSGGPGDGEATRRSGDADPQGADSADGTGDADLDALREQVDAKYDFDDFGPADMAQMSAEEWDAAFDPDTWITGEPLLDRAEAELKNRIARREVFGVLERVREDGEERVVVYSDEGYAIVHPSGEVTGRGTVLRDVEPVVALAAMESYEVPEPPDDWSLPHPDSVAQGTGEFGNWMIQIVAAVQVLAGGSLLAASLLFGVEGIIAPTVGLFFLAIGVFLFAMVANARLSDRFRAEEYRDRLRALREAEQRPDFVPIGDDAQPVEPAERDADEPGEPRADEPDHSGGAGTDESERQERR